jgi:hypothetical protein
VSRPDRTRRRRLVTLVGAAFLLGSVASPAVVAQEAPADGVEPDIDQFGGFIAKSRSNGVQVTYDSPGLLPTGSPIIQLSVPEALATLSSGPVGYALSSFAYPGPLIADLGSALEASGTDSGIPPYPIRAEAFFPSGPTEKTEGDQGTQMTARTDFADSLAHTSFAGLDVAPAGDIGGMQATSQSLIEGDQLVSRTRTAVSDISLLAGLIRIESVVTDVVATSNGNEGATAGGTEVSGLTVLGLPATIDADGIRFDERPQPEAEPNPVGDALGGALDPVTGGLQDVVAPLNDLLEQVGAAGDDALQQLFDASGIEIKVLDPVETVEGGNAGRVAPGLSVTLHYDGSNTPVFTDLLALIPSDDLPAENLGPIPFSPQALAKLLEKQHIQGFAIAPAAVAAKATPAFVFEAPDIDISSPLPSGSTGVGSSGGTANGDFETATPELPSPAESPSLQGSPTSSGSLFPLGDAVPALLVLGVLLGSPFFAAGSRRLADNTLAAAGSACPEGLDLPPEELGP